MPLVHALSLSVCGAYNVCIYVEAYTLHITYAQVDFSALDSQTLQLDSATFLSMPTPRPVMLDDVQ
jgi:hypothetical protein